MDRDSLTALLEQGLSVEEIGRRFGKGPSTVVYWIRKYGLTAANAERHAYRGGLERAELERMVAEGMSIAQIAEALERSKGTVRYWLNRYRLRTKRRRNAVGQPEARDAGLATVLLPCQHHGQTEFVIDGAGAYRCRRCRVDAVARRRRKVKRMLVDEAGGCCRICGYDRYLGALEFHHRDPDQKVLPVSAAGVSLSIDFVRAEARKCVLLCSNCHAEVEGGVTQLPLKW